MVGINELHKFNEFNELLFVAAFCLLKLLFMTEQTCFNDASSLCKLHAPFFASLEYISSSSICELIFILRDHIYKNKTPVKLLV